MLKLLALLLLQVQPLQLPPLSTVSVLTVNDTSYVSCLGIGSALAGCGILEGHTLDEVMTIIARALTDARGNEPLPTILFEVRTVSAVTDPPQTPPITVDPIPVTDDSLLQPIALQ